MTLQTMEARALHALARVALRVARPRDAKRLVDAAAALLPPVTVREAEVLARALATSGTCLSRSLVVASRLPGAEVVVAARPPAQGFAAHAWVELGGVAIGESESQGLPIDVVGRLR